MKKIALAMLVAVGLVGCGEAERSIANLTGWSKMCVEGISYLQFTSGATVQVNAEGKPVTCTK